MHVCVYGKDYNGKPCRRHLRILIRPVQNRGDCLDGVCEYTCLSASVYGGMDCENDKTFILINCDISRKYESNYEQESS